MELSSFTESRSPFTAPPLELPFSNLFDQTDSKELTFAKILLLKSGIENFLVFILPKPVTVICFLSSGN
jgi:hypothetical protein